mmetsp:Transcript_5887/g.8075  ORF Transcript_5887/g.8075 Transcript_5887/m.8075 type:complete len:618 (+) Transcript_5887:170-2023(+)
MESADHFSLIQQKLVAALQGAEDYNKVGDDEDFFITIAIDQVFERLLAQEDLDNDKKITVQDPGPKNFIMSDVGGVEHQIKGVYPLSNLLQELALLRESSLHMKGKSMPKSINLKTLYEPPLLRINRLIREKLWDGLTRTIDASGIQKIMSDEKFSEGKQPILYIPHSDEQSLEYFSNILDQQNLQFSVRKLPEVLTPEYIKTLNDEPGLLSMALQESQTGELEGAPFVVPGGRFNEMYGWDSYFESLGLIEDGRLDLAKGMVDNFVYQISHYGKILNANRSYYLTRSQPPFLSSMVLAVWECFTEEQKDIEWLKACLNAIIKEYQEVWNCSPRRTKCGLARFFGTALKAPPEVEDGHFDHVLKKYADKLGISCKEYMKKYQSGAIHEPELDEYFLHDQAVRESGHDTSYRLDGIAADLLSVDLNSLIYKYECDVASIIAKEFQDCFVDCMGSHHCSSDWQMKATERKRLINEYCWNDKHGTFFDYNLATKEQTMFDSATMIYPLWSGLATEDQATRTVDYTLETLEQAGGLASTSERSRGEISEQRPQKQWDYPFGWAPHQIMAWKALTNYGYKSHAQRLAYKWLLMLTENYVNYNGVIPEKYDVVRRSHDIFDVE